ncbi:MAG: phage major capsid protein [Romboutsia sp.]
MGTDTQFIKDNLKGSVPTEIANTVIKNIVDKSTAFKICSHTDMTSDKKVLPMLSDTGKAYWVDEGEEIGTSVHGWEYPALEAKKLAVIIPCTKEKADDSVLNVMNEIKQGISDAFIKSIDSAIFFGTNSPFDTNICETAANIIMREDGKNIDITLSEAMSSIELNDLTPNGIVAPIRAKNELRTLRDSSGNAIVINGGATESNMYNTPIHYPVSNSFDASKADFLVGDFTKSIIGTRNSITYEVLDQATVGGVNLAERDLIAIKCTLRIGFKVVNPKAFAVLKPKA